MRGPVTISSVTARLFAVPLDEVLMDEGKSCARDKRAPLALR
jgi:hypothetical protein